MATTVSYRTLRRCVVATHNILDGLYLPSLLRDYRRLHRALPLHALCIQEAVPCAAERIAAALGRQFVVASHPGARRLAIVFDGTHLRLRKLRIHLLPRLAHVPAWQRLYAGSKVQQKYALVGRFMWRRNGRCRAKPLTVVNLHLDAAGDLRHRTVQTRSLATALETRRDQPLIACGDTNAFTWVAATAERALRQVLQPLHRRHRLIDPHASQPQPTHFFARAHEPKLGQRIAVAFGRLGVDFPRRYDVVVGAPRPLLAGYMATPASDHDLAWAAFAIGRRRRPSDMPAKIVSYP